VESLTQLISEKGHFYVYVVGENVVGCIQIEEDIQDENQDACILGLLAVDPKSQSQGIGGKLIRFALKTARDIGYKIAIIWVIEERLDIIAWYSRLGFVWNGARIPFVHDDTIVPNLMFKVFSQALVL
jgi:predicted N-acetyltransferase YhbS